MSDPVAEDLPEPSRHSICVVVELAPGDADDDPSARHRQLVSKAVRLEAIVTIVSPPTVEFDDHSLCHVGEVDPGDRWSRPRGFELDQRRFEAVTIEELEPVPFEF